MRAAWSRMPTCEYGDDPRRLFRRWRIVGIVLTVGYAMAQARY